MVQKVRVKAADLPEERARVWSLRKNRVLF